jgi:DNA-3-methyladenine glycosylase
MPDTVTDKTQRIPRFTDFRIDPVTVARRLLGQRLVRIQRGLRLAGTIVETEAYLGLEDRAAHTFNGHKSARNQSMYLPGGHAYVYFTYGMHHCLNVVCGAADEGVAVLIRAIEPTEGLAEMRKHRPAARRDTDLCSGPAKLTQALNIDRSLDGADLIRGDSLFIERLRGRSLPSSLIAAGPRIGVGYAGEWATRPLRFHIRENPFVSR